jgi:hypothetical protein
MLIPFLFINILLLFRTGLKSRPLLWHIFKIQIANKKPEAKSSSDLPDLPCGSPFFDAINDMVYTATIFLALVSICLHFLRIFIYRMLD